jgi:hypothetical protein
MQAGVTSPSTSSSRKEMSLQLRSRGRRRPTERVISLLTFFVSGRVGSWTFRATPIPRKLCGGCRARAVRARVRTTRCLAAFVVGAVVIALVSGCGRSGGDDRSSAKTGDGRVVELKNIEPLREAFDRDAGKARLLMLLSPT